MGDLIVIPRIWKATIEIAETDLPQSMEPFRNIIVKEEFRFCYLGCSNRSQRGNWWSYFS